MSEAAVLHEMLGMEADWAEKPTYVEREKLLLSGLMASSTTSSWSGEEDRVRGCRGGGSRVSSACGDRESTVTGFLGGLMVY